MKKWIKRLIIFCIFLFAGSFIGLFYLLPMVLVDIKHLPSHIPKNTNSYSNTEELNIVSEDGLKLSGTMFYPDTLKSKHTIILLHGIRGSKDMYFAKAKDIASNWHINVLVVDLRGHGKSEGTFCTFGVKEKNDISKWASKILETIPDTKIGIWGQSLGGAIGLQTLAIDKRIGFAIIESTFSELSNVGPDYIERLLGIRWKYLNNFISWRIESLADFKVEDTNPKKACKEIDQAILLVHGSKDDRINPKYCLENFSALKSKDRSLLFIPEATHVDLWSVGSISYQNTVKQFILNH